MIFLIKVDLQSLKEKIAPDIFSKGISFFVNNRVSSFTYDTCYCNESSYPLCNISSTILDFDNNNHSIKVSIDPYNILDCSCSCKYCSSKNNICQHVVATILAYNDKYKRLAQSNKNSFNDISIFKDSSINSLSFTGKGFFDSLKTSLYRSLDEDSKVSVNLEPILNINTSDNESSMQLKIGIEKLYIVKSMTSFVESIKTGIPLEMGKDFTFDPSVHSFKKSDSSLIQIILELHDRYEDFAFESKNKIESNFLKGKKAILSEYQVKKILRLFKNRSFFLNVNGTMYNCSHILEEQLPFTFFIDLSNNIVKIKQGESLPIPITRDFSYFLYNNDLYKTTSKQKNVYKIIFNELNKNKEISLKNSNLELLGDCIIPALNSINANIVLNESIKTFLNIAPLKCTVYLDKLDDLVTCRVIFKYDSTIINPFSYNKDISKDKILVRDIEKETKIINILEKFNFTVQVGELSINDDKDLLEFMDKGLEELSSLCEIYYSDTFKNIKLYKSYKIFSNLKINNEDLIEFSFNIADIPNTEIQDIFSSIKLKKKYHKLKSGSFLYLDSPDLNIFFETLNNLDIDNCNISDGNILLNKYNSLYLNEKLQDNEIVELYRDSTFKEIISSVSSIQTNEFKVPNNINPILRDYQKLGFKWFKTLSYCNFGGILADEMGLGKTIQAIAFINSLKEDFPNEPILVVCPTSLIYNWDSEITKFSPNLKALVISGNKSLREELISSSTNYDVIITSYPLIRLDIEYYKQLNFTCCFLDEAQHIKNPYSVNAQSVKELKTKFKFALTGTPLENSLSELWSIFDFIMPGYLLGHNSFKSHFEIPIVKENNSSLLEDLNKRIKPFILRRTKNEVLKELPPKIEHKLFIELNDSQKLLYASYVNDYKNQIEEDISNNNLSKNKFKILSLITRLRQICCDPSIFIDNYAGESSKIETLCELVHDCISQNRRLLIFSQFTSVLKNIQSKLDDSEISSIYLDGKTPSLKRLELVEDFNNCLHDVFLISLKAGGTGLNLTSADTVIHFDPWWNPAVEDQATDRAHRIGQDKPVEVIKLITKGTIEDKISILQERKKDIFSNVMNDSSNSNMLVNLTEDDIRFLFNL